MKPAARAVAHGFEQDRGHLAVVARQETNMRGGRVGLEGVVAGGVELRHQRHRAPEDFRHPIRVHFLDHRQDCAGRCQIEDEASLERVARIDLPWRFPKFQQVVDLMDRLLQRLAGAGLVATG